MGRMGRKRARRIDLHAILAMVFVWGFVELDARIAAGVAVNCALPADMPIPYVQEISEPVFPRSAEVHGSG